MFDIALDPISAILYGVSGNGRLYSIDQVTASTSLIGNTSAFINGLTFSSDGTLYGTGTDSLYTLNLATGAAGLIGTGNYDSSGDIAFDDAGNLYLSSTTGAGDSLWTIDTSSGVGTLLGQTGFTNVYGLNYANDTLYGFTSSGTTLALDTLTGAGSSLPTNGIQAYGADGVGGVTNVSEPASIALFSLGLIGLGWLRRGKTV
jgi:sugar lactone lactonase YvrE